MGSDRIPVTRPVPVVAALTVALIATWYLVLRSALFVDVLVLDELTLVPAVTGAETGLEHLLAPHHGHRLVLPRALQELTLWLSGNRLWTPRFLTLVAMLGSAALFLALARRLRGGPAPEDMVVPLALLRPDLAGAFTHAFDLQFALWNRQLQHRVVRTADAGVRRTGNRAGRGQLRGPVAARCGMRREHRSQPGLPPGDSHVLP